jgi:DNA-binding NarL/FixJ family response regulator
MPRILIADGHGLYRRGLRGTLEAELQNVEIWEADCLDRVLSIVEAEGSIELILIDFALPGAHCLDSLREAREYYSDIRFLVISASDAREDVLGCLRVGLHGFVSKLQPDHEIVVAVQRVLDGAIYVPPWLASRNTFESQRLGPQTAQRHQDPVAKLTPRQRDVLPLLAKGMSNKEIARALNIAEGTTKVHAAAICRLLGVRNRIEAALAASELLERPGDANQRA